MMDMTRGARPASFVSACHSLTMQGLVESTLFLFRALAKLLLHPNKTAESGGGASDTDTNNKIEGVLSSFSLCYCCCCCCRLHLTASLFAWVSRASMHSSSTAMFSGRVACAEEAGSGDTHTGIERGET